MFETTHRVFREGELYEYPAIKTAVRRGKKTITFMRIYGFNRTEEEAIGLCQDWLLKQKKDLPD